MVKVKNTFFVIGFVGLILLAFTTGASANQVSVGQFGIEYPSAETLGYYGFTVDNLTGNSTLGACNPSYPVCTELLFANATLSVEYAYGQIDSSGNVIPGSLGSVQTFTVTAAQSDPFDSSYNGCGVYGVDSGCAGLSDVSNAFQLTEPIVDGSGNTLVILSATFTATTSPTTTNLGTLSGPYTATLYPTTDCGGPCNFLDPSGGLYPGDPYPGDWEYYDANVDIVTTTPTAPVSEPATLWLVLSVFASAIWLRRPRTAFVSRR